MGQVSLAFDPESYAIRSCGAPVNEAQRKTRCLVRLKRKLYSSWTAEPIGAEGGWGISKVVETFNEAVADIPDDGATMAISGAQDPFWYPNNLTMA